MRFVLCAALVFFGRVGYAAPPALPACLDRPVDERNGCVSSWAAETPLAWRDWRDLAELVRTDPELALRAIEWLEAEGLDESRTIRLLDLRGSALSTTGRHDEAAAAFLTAIAIDDGTLRVTRADGDPLAVGPGAGRLERVARALAAAGRNDAALPFARQSVELGAGSGARELWDRLGGGFLEGLDPNPTPLLGRRWFPRLPQLTVDLLDGSARRVPREDDKVLILDFWASWCEPCARALPLLQELYLAERARGLSVVTFNMDEPEETARMFADALGLSLPIALYNEDVDRALEVRNLPTVIVADRLGRVRRRSTGSQPDSPDEVAELTRELLDDATAIPEIELGRVLLGAGTLLPLWVQEVPAIVEGLVLLPPGEDDEGARILIVAARSLAALDADGSVVRRREVGAVAGALRRGDLDGDGVAELVTFRPGARQIAGLEPVGDAPLEWEAPAPVLDVCLVPATEGDPGAILVGTTAGLWRSVGSSWTFRAVEGVGAVRDLAIAAGVPVVLEFGGVIRRLGQTAGDPQPGGDPEARRILTRRTTEGIVVATEGVTAWVAGRFLPGSPEQIALATSEGQLILVDAGSDRVLFRARWEGIRALAAGDLGSAGLQDLIIAAGSRIARLRAPPPS